MPTQMHDSWSAGLKQGCLLGLAVLSLALPIRHSLTLPAPAVVATAAAPVQRQLDFGSERSASLEVTQVARWVVAAADNGHQPFVILDKRDARAFVFEASGKLRAATPVLLGHAAGDDSVAGIGQRPIADVKPEERTTPAGRFAARPGRNTLGEEVLWVDYDAAVSMHRVRLTDPRERRLERLASPDARQRRISYGCINLPVAFFEDVLWPHFGRQGGVVYVLPEHKPLRQVFPGLRDWAVAANALT